MTQTRKAQIDRGGKLSWHKVKWQSSMICRRVESTSPVKNNIDWSWKTMYFIRILSYMKQVFSNSATHFYQIHNDYRDAMSIASFLQFSIICTLYCQEGEPRFISSSLFYCRLFIHAAYQVKMMLPWANIQGGPKKTEPQTHDHNSVKS